MRQTLVAGAAQLMFAVIQFPLTDVRSLLDEDTGRITAPVWPIVQLPDEPHKAPFVRGFGRARRRAQGGIQEWAAEGTYCDVSHALRFVERTLKDHPAATAIPKRYCAFRRLFWDGQLKADGSIVGRVEVGYGLRAIAQEAAFGGPALADLVDALLALPVRIAPAKAQVTATATATTDPAKISNAGPALAKAFLQASTRTDKTLDPKSHSWWLQAGSPFVILEYLRDQEVEALPADTRPVVLPGKMFAGIRVFLGRRTLQGRDRAVWYFECSPEGYDRDALRRLRINVVRLQSVISSLRILLDLLQKKRIAPAAEPARTNLSNALGSFLPVLYQKEAQGFPMTEFLRAAFTLQEALTPAEFATLREIYPNPGRGLEAQMRHSSGAIAALQDAAPDPIEWDVFLAHAGADTLVAEQLYALLDGKIKVFLDSKSLLPGDDWDLRLPEAQRRSHMSVVLIGETTETAYYLRSEIASAISLARIDSKRHRVIPVYLQGAAARATAQPYGLNLKHGVELGGTVDLEGVAQKIIQTLKATVPASTDAAS